MNRTERIRRPPGHDGLKQLVETRLTPLARRLAALRRRLGHDPVICRACRWRGDRSACHAAPARRPIDAYTLPGAGWRGPLVDLCPRCARAAIQDARPAGQDQPHEP